MDTIKFLLAQIVRLALVLFLVAFVLWLIGLLFPQFQVSNLISSNIFKTDWLPAPRNYGLLGKSRQGGMNGTEYVPGAPYDGYKNASYQPQEGVDFYVYTASGTRVVRSQGSAQMWGGENGGISNNPSAYLRNLSIFSGGGLTYSQRIFGEARATMFRDGSFPIYIVDANNRLVTSMQAVNTGMRAMPGWVRFQATVPNRLPGDSYCTLVFGSANQSFKISLPVHCNN